MPVVQKQCGARYKLLDDLKVLSKPNHSYDPMILCTKNEQPDHTPRDYTACPMRKIIPSSYKMAINQTRNCYNSCFSHTTVFNIKFVPSTHIFGLYNMNPYNFLLKNY